MVESVWLHAGCCAAVLDEGFVISRGFPIATPELNGLLIASIDSCDHNRALGAGIRRLQLRG